MILFLGNIPAQARDDLVKLKRMMGQRDKPLISELDNLGALKILAAIKSNTPCKICFLNINAEIFEMVEAPYSNYTVYGL